MTIVSIIFYMTICYVILQDDYVFYSILYDNILYHLLDDYVFYSIVYDNILYHFAKSLSFL